MRAACIVPPYNFKVSPAHSYEPPNSPIISSAHITSDIKGTFSIIKASPVNIEEKITGSTAFFAAEISTVPKSSLLPDIL